MSFLRYSEYVQQKTEAKKTVRYMVDQYREETHANLAHLVLTKTDYFEEAVNSLLNIGRIERMLHEAHYPQAESVCIALQTGNDEKVSQKLNSLRRWLEQCGLPVNSCALIERACLDYRSKQITKEFEPEDVDAATANLVEDCYHFLDTIKGKLEAALTKIDWDDQEIVLEAVVPESGLKVQQARLHLGEMYKMTVDINRTEQGFVVQEVEFPVLPDSLKQQFQSLIGKLRSSDRYGKILSLYLPEPQAKRSLYENKKLDVSLGIQSILPKNTILLSRPDGDQDVWRVRIASDNLVKVMEEGDLIAYRLLEEARLRWIERVENEA